MRRRLVVPILVAVLAGVGSWFFGVGILPAIIIGLAIGSVGIVLRLASIGGNAREWPPAPPLVTDGARRESSDLSWAIRARGSGVDDRIVLRIRRIAADRLAARQLDLDNPAHRAAIQALLGRQATETLLDPRAHPVRIPEVVAMLDILDRLERRPAEQQAPPALAAQTHLEPHSEKKA